MKSRGAACGLRALVLLAGLVVLGESGVSAAPVAIEDLSGKGLSREETGVLRRSLYAVSTVLYGSVDDTVQLVMREAVQIAPSLSDAQFERIEQHLARHAPTRRQAHEIMQVRMHWRQRPAKLFTFWWNRTQAGSTGLPSRAPTRAEVREIEALAMTVAGRLELPRPRYMPFRIDKRAAVGQVYGQDELRWGVVGSEIMDRELIARAVVVEAGGLPYLARALGVLHGTCGDDAEKRAATLAAARTIVGHSGYVPVLEGLQVGSFGGSDDPALASGLLFVDYLERELGGAALGKLVVALPEGASAAEHRRLLRDLTGSSARKLDRGVQRALRDSGQ